MLLLLFGEKSKEIPEEYYVAVDSVESIGDNRYQIIFDGVISKEFNETSRDGNIWQLYEKVIPRLIVVNLNHKSSNKLNYFINQKSFSGFWFKIKTSSKPTDLAASMFVENFQNDENKEPVLTFIYSIESLPKYSDTSRNLTRFFSWDHYQRGNTKAIEKHLKSIKPKNEVHKLNVYNVGQGSLTAVTGQNNVPLFYFDLGGAWWIFPDSYPRTLNLCFNCTRTVILSHWDLDHIETARRLIKSNCFPNITWIAPKQTLSPFYAGLAARMNTNGELLLWSGNFIKEIKFWAGSLLKCNGPDKNHSGLALLVKSPNNDIQNVLHPGDAAYKYIPKYKSLKLDGLVATHHGANFETANSPLPVSVLNYGAIAYSHGNKYGHPTPGSKIAHQSLGWTNERETTKGNISFTLNSNNKSVPCNGNDCDLRIQQTF
jgi:hypothetical protein